MAKIVRVEAYKNAIIINEYYAGKPLQREIIKIRWYQRSKARHIIDIFYLTHITDFYSKGIEWQFEDLSKTMRWNFKNHHPE